MKCKISYDPILHFGENFPDGRLAMPSDGKKFDLMKVIKEVERLERPLKEEELKKYIIIDTK